MESAARLERSKEGRLITGVCAGLGRYTNIDPVIYRAGFALLALSGWGIVLYIGALLIVPPEGRPSKVQRITRRSLDGETTLTMIGALLAAIVALDMLNNWMSPDALVGIVVFALALLVARARGADLVQVAREFPDRLKGRPLSAATAPAPPPSGMIDLAAFSAVAAPPRDTRVTVEYPPLYDSPPQPPEPAEPPKRPGHWSALVPLTLLAAALAAAVMLPVAAGRSDYFRTQVMLAAALTVVGGGLVVSAWAGRGRGLLAIGALLSLSLSASSLAHAPETVGHMGLYTWRPVNALEAADGRYRVLFGSGTADLTQVPLPEAPGWLSVHGVVTAGRLEFRVPKTVWLTVRGRVLLGDIDIDGKIVSGPRARVDRTIPPEGHRAGPAARIELNLTGRLGDIEVVRV